MRATTARRQCQKNRIAAPGVRVEMSAGRNKNSKTRMRKRQRAKANLRKADRKVMLRQKRAERRKVRAILKSKNADDA